MNRRYVMMAFVMLVLAMLACNRTVPTATPKTDTSGTEVATADVTPSLATDEPQLTPTSPLSSDTPAPGSATPTEGTPVCAYDAGFVADVTIPDDTELESNEVFTKTWRMRNTGDCAWEPGTLWAFDSGDQMDGPESVKAPILEPGDTADISVGLVAPDEPGTYTGYWRLRRPNAEDFGTRGYVRIIVSSDAGTPIPSATPTGEAGTAPTILFFRSNVDEADPGDTVTLEWETEGATRASLYHLMPTGQLGGFWEVEVDGTLDYDIDEGERNHTGFLLVATNDEESSTQASLSITLRCPDTWFFEPAPDACPASPAIVTAGAEQPFEHGVMIWVEDEGMIYVLFDDGNSPRWRAYADEWNAGEPENDPIITPPAGYYQPVRGFGLIWRERLGVRDRLGWATEPEEAFDTAVQRTSRAKYNDTFIRALDGSVWKLLPESSGWEKIP